MSPKTSDDTSAAASGDALTKKDLMYIANKFFSHPPCSKTQMPVYVNEGHAKIVRSRFVLFVFQIFLNVPIMCS